MTISTNSSTANAAKGFCRKFWPDGCRVYDPTTGSAGWMATAAFKGSHFERDVILWGVRWYVAYPLSYRQIEEMMEERGVEVDHSTTLNCWVLKYVLVLEKAFLACKRPVGGIWRFDETYVRVKGAWKYLYRAVELRFLRKAIDRHGVPGTIPIDKSSTNMAAIVSYNAEQDADVEIRQAKYLNNIVEQDHRAIKRLTRPMLGFKAFWSTAITLAGIEIVHMIRKGPLRKAGKLRPAQQFYSLAG